MEGLHENPNEEEGVVTPEEVVLSSEEVEKPKLTIVEDGTGTSREVTPTDINEEVDGNNLETLEDAANDDGHNPYNKSKVA